MARELELRPKIQKQWKSLVLVSSGVASSWGVTHSEAPLPFLLRTGEWCQKTAELGLSPETPAVFGVYAPDYMSQFKVKAMSLFALFAFLEWRLHFLYPPDN